MKVDGVALPPTAANERYARRLAADVERALRSGTFDMATFFPDTPLDEPESFALVAEDWLTSKGQLTAATLSQYRSSVALWVRLLGADTPMDRIGYQTLSKTVGGHKWASGKSANNHLIVLRGIFGYHYAGPRSAQNPMTGVENLPVVKKRPDPLSSHERDAILADMTKHYDPRVSAYFTFAFYTGMRPEEMIALRWGDIDFNLAIAHVCRVRTFRGSEREGSKTHESRDVDLLPQAIEALATMKAFTFMKGVDADIFEHPVSRQPWHDERSQRDTFWKPCLRRLGIRQRRAYTTRHTYATVALMGGVRPAYVAEQMGHRSLRMFFEVYARWINGADKGVQRAAMAEAFSAPVRPPQPETSANPLISLPNSGRRDWIRTNETGDCGGNGGDVSRDKTGTDNP